MLETLEQNSSDAAPAIANKPDFTTAPSSSQVTMAVIKDIDELNLIGEQWDEFAVDPMSGFDWNAAWWDAFQSTGELHVLKFERGGKLIGIGPFYLDRWFGLRRLRFLGSGKTCSDYVDLICRPEDQTLLDGLLAQYLRSQNFPVTELEGTRHDRLSVQLISMLKEDFRIEHRDIEPTWMINLPKSWEEFVSGSGSFLRRKIRKAEKRLNSGEFVLRSTAADLDVDDAFKIFQELHIERYLAKGESGAFDDPNFGPFLRAALHRLCDKRQAEIVTVEHLGTPVGAQILLVAETGYQYYQSGYSTEHLKSEPGYMMFTATLKQAIAQGHETFDFLRGNEAYKAKWGAVSGNHKKLRLISRRVIPTVVSQSVALGRFAVSKVR